MIDISKFKIAYKEIEGIKRKFANNWIIQRISMKIRMRDWVLNKKWVLLSKIKFNLLKNG